MPRPSRDVDLSEQNFQHKLSLRNKNSAQTIQQDEQGLQGVKKEKRNKNKTKGTRRKNIWIRRKK